ncbi:poly [ADP-ribose] polymerase tankyrase-1 [Heracleum sosnowskyi]|uniref:Poly [ADP-ribose] polymerase tankyrase-1 n=1 Tax=Heracleum sosnowskyi TaxID=360622 RepID=A0AAD8MNG7_9APIA|nr:poly [ADP-ribose] polymerase tankyrase-1 [Heracleum sosnowskyi]
MRNWKQSEVDVHAAARAGDLSGLQLICSSNPLAINSRDKHSRTPLHLAAWSGQAPVVSYLCENKADVGAAAMDDMGAIHFAAQKGHLKVVQILISSGVSVKSANRKGMTALHYAAQGSSFELVKYLVKKGANLDAKTKAGKTPVDLASNEEVRTFLVESQSILKNSAIDCEKKPEDIPELSKENEEDIKTETAVSKAEDADLLKDESTKRKNDSKDDAKEDFSEQKKAKIALNHLLASDDAQEDEDNL